MGMIILQMMMSVDGFVSGPTSQLDWIINDPELEKMHHQVLKEADSVLLGHNAYLEMSDFWIEAETDGDSNDGQRSLAKTLNAKPKTIIATKDDSLGWKNSSLLQVEDEPDLIKKLKKLKTGTKGYLLLYGGVQTAQTLLTYGLVDELRLDVCPVALGDGKALFPAHIKLEFINVKSYASGAMTVTYKPR